MFLWRNLTSTAITSAAAALSRKRPELTPQAKPTPPTKAEPPIKG